MPRHPATLHLLTLSVQLATNNQFYADAPLSDAADAVIDAADAVIDAAEALDDYLTEPQPPSETEH